MPEPVKFPAAPPGARDAMRAAFQPLPPAYATESLLRDLLAELRGLRQDLRATESFNGFRVPLLRRMP